MRDNIFLSILSDKYVTFAFFCIPLPIKAECRRACDLILCGRNAECKADNHAATCSCKHGFFGNVKDDKIGCQPIECEVNDDCTQEKICDYHRCRIACLAHNPCGVNAICTTEKHIQVIISLLCTRDFFGSDLYDNVFCGIGLHVSTRIHGRTYTRL